MTGTFLSAIYLFGLLFAEGLRLPHRINRLRNRKAWSGAKDVQRASEWLVLGMVILGIWILPLIHTFTPWLAAFDYQLPDWTIWPAVLLFGSSLALRWAAQRKLAEHWSFTLETASGHILIQDGIYAFTRHPIYFSLIFWAVAQALLLQNLLAGFGGAVAVLLIWLIRVPREEQMMVAVFGEQYRVYSLRTGRFYPHRKSKHRAGV